MKSFFIFKGSVFKQLVFGGFNTGGRNNQGKITAYHRGGGLKRRIRIVDYKKYVWNVFGFIKRIEYDPLRNSLLALIIYSNGIISYSVAVERLHVGDFIYNTELSFAEKVGCSSYLRNFSVGSRISLIESNLNVGAQFVRSAGNFGVVISKSNHLVMIRLRSGEIRQFPSYNIATLGSVSNFQFMFQNFQLAGYWRRRGWRPVVRGVAMNPVDHPHGGGQGKTSGGRPSVTPFGFITKGKPTVKKKHSKWVVKSRKKIK